MTGTAMPVSAHRVHEPISLVSAYVMVSLVLLMTQLDQYLGNLGAYGRLGFLVFPTIALPYVLVVLCAPRSDEMVGRALSAWRRNGLVLWLFLAWTLWHLVCLSGQSLIDNDDDVTRLFPIYHLVVLLFGMALAVAPDDSTVVRRGATFAFLVLGASVIADLIFPGTFSVRSYRPAGLTTDANVTAATLLMILPFCLRYDRFRAGSIVLMVAGFMLVMLTLSRSGLMMWAVLAGIYVLAAGRRRPFHTLLLIAAFVAAAVSLMIVFADLVASLDIARMPEVERRIDQLLMRTDVLADDYRPALLRYFLQIALQEPLVGQGTGYALGFAKPGAPFGLGPHNIYLREWIDLGMVGLVLYLLIPGSALIAAWARRSPLLLAVAVIMLIGGLFSHTVIDSKSTLMALAMALALSAPEGNRGDARGV
ncbi:MAG TPA: O-antigen ligase family protein [Geminicoccus sp.]|jgi:O-antigen ligase|uniref:O-antigen ligase family protein n=1 Tax=Geminicoccus sp. TaxID=2024832 RepID=UPI002E375824|nr:O-antigen ligase family protein [Geminicoccus sp.]HEX2526680.1 O-antigen ligase family protein [Geminicoccus sp.]